jgi:hypothetical protein
MDKPVVVSDGILHKKKIKHFSVLLWTNNHENILFWFLENGKIIHFEKNWVTFPSGVSSPS